MGLYPLESTVVIMLPYVLHPSSCLSEPFESNLQICTRPRLWNIPELLIPFLWPQLFAMFPDQNSFGKGSCHFHGCEIVDTDATIDLRAQGPVPLRRGHSAWSLAGLDYKDSGFTICCLAVRWYNLEISRVKMHGIDFGNKTWEQEGRSIW